MKKYLENLIGCIICKYVLSKPDGLRIKRSGNVIQIVRVFSENFYINHVQPVLNDYPSCRRKVKSWDRLYDKLKNESKSYDSNELLILMQNLEYQEDLKQMIGNSFEFFN